MAIDEHTAPSSSEALLLIERLVQFAEQRRFIHALDRSLTRNALLDLFQFSEPTHLEVPEENLSSAVPIIDQLLDYGYAIGLMPDQTVTYRDLLDARIMGLLMPRPSEVVRNFRRREAEAGIARATEEFYQLNMDCNYIRMDRIEKNQYWLHETAYGKLEMTINLSKPEKDPKEIALLRSMPQSNYPKCLLCENNVGYAGRPDHPGRQNLRVIPLELQSEGWYFQYSPYVYYNEHSIVFKETHEAMAVTHQSVARLLDFIEQMPHYFIGSNADLPIVGGSILSHDHFQAGRHKFPMEIAEVETSFLDDKFEDVRVGIVNWPMTVLRLNSVNKVSILKVACRLLDLWREYSDPEAEVMSHTKNDDGSTTPHNTITPIARLRDSGEYELDLVLRNNRTSEEHPDGIFHPHQHLHHIKKENIGLIEVMGLAVLPGRLKVELEQVSSLLTRQEEQQVEELLNKAHPLHKHFEWISALQKKYGTTLSVEQARETILAETGNKFLQVLEDAGVFKRTAQGIQSLRQFLSYAGVRV